MTYREMFTQCFSWTEIKQNIKWYATRPVPLTHIHIHYYRILLTNKKVELHSTDFFPSPLIQGLNSFLSKRDDILQYKTFSRGKKKKERETLHTYLCGQWNVWLCFTLVCGVRISHKSVFWKFFFFNVYLFFFFR